MGKTVTLIGGTGTIGQSVANEFFKEGYKVKILTRNIEKAIKKLPESYELIKGDVNEEDSIREALNESQNLHINLNSKNLNNIYDTIVNGITRVIKLALEFNIAKITYSSSVHAVKEYEWFSLMKARSKAESLIESSGLPYTVFKSSQTMDYLGYFVRGNRANVISDISHKIHWFASDELARLIVETHTSSKFANQTINIIGPEALTIKEAISAYCDTLKPGARLTEIPLSMFTSIATMSNNGELQYTAEFMKYLARANEDGFDLANQENVFQLTTTLNDWCEQVKKVNACHGNVAMAC
ncbi:MAG: SDR family oxidoreductase [Bacteroidales bacterium]|nr:SDR family oxidoreductase [Bacteroidales bacterium]